ncbi:MAG: gliding motility-associated protein GldE [Chitinophagales bacterium]
METNPDGGGDYYPSLLTDIPLASIINTNLDWWTIILGFLVVFILVLASALVSGSEVAFFSITPNQKKQLKRSKTKVGSQILQLLDKPRYLLATILIANNLFNIGIVITTFFLTRQIFTFNESLPLILNMGIFNVQLDPETLINVVGVTFILVLFGEVMPKVYAQQYNLRLATVTAYPLSVLKWSLAPISRSLIVSTSFLERKLDERTSKNVDMQEINDMIDIVAGEQVTEKDYQMLKGIVKFGDIEVSKIMHNRMEVFAMDYDTPFDELISEIKEKNYSRLPIYEEHLDEIKGILYVKDLLAHTNKTGSFDWHKLLKKPFFVPENKKIYKLLKEMQRKKVHLAIIVDEYGGTSGLVTLEDIIEEILGEIEDETSTVAKKEDQQVYRYKADRNNYTFEGKIMLHDACKFMRIDTGTFDGVEGDFDSLGGLLLELEGRFIQEGEKVAYKGFTFTVLSTQDNLIDRVKVEIKRGSPQQ